ncbi:MAG: sugar transferase [Gemmatimonadaceae bacterium]
MAECISNFDWSSALPPEAGSRWYALRQWFKRLLDFFGATVGLLILAPACLIVAVLVSLDGGQVFYRWRVVGYRGQPFTGYKFRTMVENADAVKDELQHLNEMSGPMFKIRRDPRVTPLGRFLRRHSIDELPQLWSVLKGDMSLVGPRPASAREFVSFAPAQRLKLAVRPGLTCLWQISGRTEISDFDEWVRLDLQYIREWSIWLDLTIIARTVGVVLTGRGGF